MGTTETTETTESIVAAVEALLPEIRARAGEIASARRLPDDLVVALQRAGAFRMPMPRSWGGPEVSLPDQIRIVELLATADPAVGWCCMIGSDSGFYSAFLADAAAKTLWTDIDDITAGWLFPAGRAVPVEGGYRVNGRWSFGSCSLHAHVLVGGCMVVDETGALQVGADGLPLTRVVAARAEQFEILDTWYTTGLAGSGSNDYTCTDLFVPAEHTFSVGDASQRPGALYAMSTAFFTNVPGVPLGLARRAIDETIAIMTNKHVLPEFTLMADLPRVRSAIADAEMQLRSTRAYVYRAMDDLWDALSAGQPITPAMRVDVSLSRIQSFRAAREISLQMVQLAGTQAIYSTSVLDRLLRDAITMGQHVVGGPVITEMTGGLAMGIEPTGMMAGLV